MRRYATATTLLLLGISACSSAPAAGPNLPNGALPSGTAQIRVNGNGTGRLRDVQCESIGKGLTQITIGNAGSLTTVLVAADSQRGSPATTSTGSPEATGKIYTPALGWAWSIRLTR
jgi:hypothetical protein